MLTTPWEAESPGDISTAAAAGVEERVGSKGVTRNGVCFLNTGVRKVASFSGGLQEVEDSKHSVTSLLQNKS